MRWLVLLLSGLLVLTACGGGGGGGGGGGDKDPDATLRIATDIEVGHATYFDPTLYTSSPLPFTNMIYDTLLYFGEDGLEPGLATDWSFPDNSTVELTLREGVKFQDGTPLNAEAVKFSWDRIIAAGPEMTKVAALAALQSIEVVDDLTVRVHLAQPVAGDWRDRLLFSSQAGIGIVSPTAVQAAEAAGNPFNDAPVGAGPYKFVEFVPGQRIVLERWDGYWNPDAQQVQRLEYVHTLRGAPTVTALAGGRADIAYVQPSDVDGLRAQGLVVDEFPPIFRQTFEQFCTSRAPFDNLEARQAAAHAIDREPYIQAAYQGFAVANDKFPAPGWPYYPADIENPYSYDPDRARELVEEAGVEGATVTIITAADAQSAAFAQIMQEQLNAVGFDTQIQQSQSAFSELSTADWNIYVGGGTFPTTSSAFFLPGGVGNACNYDNPELTAAFDATRNPQASVEDLRQAWVDFNQAAYDDAAFFTVADASDLVAHTENVQGVTGEINAGDVRIMGQIYMTE
jgi:peptide/nickel transport system substrate-binding protein